MIIVTLSSLSPGTLNSKSCPWRIFQDNFLHSYSVPVLGHQLKVFTSFLNILLEYDISGGADNQISQSSMPLWDLFTTFALERMYSSYMANLWQLDTYLYVYVPDNYTSYPPRATSRAQSWPCWSPESRSLVRDLVNWLGWWGKPLFEMCCFHMCIGRQGGWGKGLPGWFGASCPNGQLFVLGGSERFPGWFVHF